jgi:putative MATE family efflux protein
VSLIRLTGVDRRILRLALPALGTLAAEPLYRLVDTAIVGRLGTEELGGLAVAVSVLTLVIAGSNFLAYGTTERIARRLGAGEERSAADVGVQAMWLAVFVGVIAVPLLIVLARPLTSLLGAEDRVLDLGTQYLQISAFGVPFVLVGLSAQGVLRGVSDYDTPLRILIVANVVNLVVELIFVLGFGLGVPGAAWSTVIAQVGAGIAFVRLVQPQLAAATDRRPHWAEMAPLLSAGRHLLLRVGSMLAVFTGSTAIAVRIDDATLAAHQITLTMFFFLALSLDALAVPAQTLVAEELGGGDPLEARRVARRVVVLSLWTAGVLAGLLALASPLLARVFSADEAVVSRATTGLLLLAVLLIPGAVAFAYDGVLIGAGDYRFLGLAAFGYLLAVAPIAVVVLAVPDLGIAGLWIGLIFWMIVRAFVNHLRARVMMGR